jgi:hypothetical protein
MSLVTEAVPGQATSEPSQKGKESARCLPAVEPFPVEVLPGVLADFVRAGAEALGCPPDYLAVPMLVLAGAAIGTARCVEAKESWRELPSLFACIVGGPGSGKSPALKVVAAPVERRQRELQARYERERKGYEAGLRRRKAAKKTQEKSRAPSDTSGASDTSRAGESRPGHRDADPDPGRCRDAGPDPREPVMERVVTSDATVESLSPILANNPRGIALVRDELAAWVRSFNMYRGGRGNDRQYFLSVWSGQPIVIDRKNVPHPLIIERPFLGIAGGLVPDMLPELADEQGCNDGFLDRILFSWPDHPGCAPWSEATIPPDLERAWEGALAYLWGLRPSAPGERGAEPQVVKMTASAKEVWVAFYNEEAAALSAPDCLPASRGVRVKLFCYCLRLALILHELRLAAGEESDEAVGEGSMRGAVALAGYFLSHAERCYAAMVKPEEGAEADNQDLLRAAAQVAKDNGGTWQGTATELLELLVGQVSETARQRPDWPASVDSLGRAMRKLAPSAPQRAGLSISFGRSKDKQARRLIILTEQVSEVTERQNPPAEVAGAMPVTSGAFATSDTSFLRERL